MKKELKKYCESINIEYVGIAPPGPYHDFEKIWRKQIERGYISGLEEKDIKKRVYPNLILDDVKSVIVCLFPYYTGKENINKSNISKYAYGIDYHTIVKEKLESIGEFLSNKIEGFHYKAFVDTGPLSDRYLAYKAGLGFWGINNNIITDKYGSYVFIGYILNNFPFEADKPQERTCKQCFTCVRECPGDCILGDFTINSLRCKSYITQKKGELTSEEIDIVKKDNLIWGCDVCQDVCPHNQNVKETMLEEFKQNLIYNVDYNEIKDISNKEFSRRFKDRAFGWRGRGVLVRNHEVLHK